MHHITIEKLAINTILSYRGYAMQEFGDRLFTKLYPNEYIAVRAGGPMGDLKNDGYCYINRTFFHFHGTRAEDKYKLKSKITKDIEGCLAKQMDVQKIIYVTNDSSLAALEGHIDLLRSEHSIDIDSWGPERLVEAMRSLPLRDIEYILQMPLKSDPTIIRYTIDTSSLIIHSRKKVKYRNLFTFSCIIIVIILMKGYEFLNLHIENPFLVFYVLGIAGILTLLAVSQQKYIKMAISRKEEENLHDGGYIIKTDENYKEYRKTACCTYGECNGVVRTRVPPEREKYRFSVIGCCSLNAKIHTFSIDKENVGYPVSLNWEPLPPKLSPNR